MHPTTMQLLAQHKIEAFDREAETSRRAAIARQASERPSEGPTRRGRPGWLRLVMHRLGAAA